MKYWACRIGRPERPLNSDLRARHGRRHYRAHLGPRPRPESVGIAPASCGPEERKAGWHGWSRGAARAVGSKPSCHDPPHAAPRFSRRYISMPARHGTHGSTSTRRSRASHSLPASSRRTCAVTNAIASEDSARLRHALDGGGYVEIGAVEKESSPVESVAGRIRLSPACHADRV